MARNMLSWGAATSAKNRNQVDIAMRRMVTTAVTAAFVGVAGLATLSGPAQACTSSTGNPVVLCNTTEVLNTSSGSSGGTGSTWQSTGIGSPTYNTPQASVAWTQVGNTQDFSSVTISFVTGLATGLDTSYQSSNGVTIDAADIFIKSGGGTVLPGAGGSSYYNYGISLGFTGGSGGGVNEGGNSSAGLYALAANPTNNHQYQTSQDIWDTSSHSGFTYGGEYAPSSDFSGVGAPCSTGNPTCSAAQAAPTVLDAGNGNALVCGTSGANDITTTVNPGAQNGVSDVLSVTLSASGSCQNQLYNIFSQFDIFWGTGDCSNAPIWGDLTTTTGGINNRPVPEPSSLMLLVSGLLGLPLLRRRRRTLETAA